MPNPTCQNFCTVKHLVRRVCVVIFSLHVSLPAWGDSSQPINSDPALKHLSVKEVLDRVKEQTGYEVNLIGDIPEPRASINLGDIGLPQDIDQLATGLGIRSHAAEVDSEALTIKLWVLHTVPQKGTSAPERATLGADEKLTGKSPPQAPYLTPAEEASVAEFYKELQDRLPKIDTSLSAEDKLAAEEGVPFGGAYLKSAEGKGVVSFYRRLQDSVVPAINTSIALKEEQEVNAGAPPEGPHLTAAEATWVISFYNQKKTELLE